MSLQLRVQRGAWYRHVEDTLNRFGGPEVVIPVVKGNGYGFGRSALVRRVYDIGGHHFGAVFGVAVGTVHEAAGFAGAVSPMTVLTPEIGALPPHLAADTVLTVGSRAQVMNLARQGWEGPVVVKLQSSMRRYGVDPAEFAPVVNLVNRAGCRVVGHGLHLPLAGDDAQRVAEIEQWIPYLDPEIPVAISHVEPETFADLRDRFGEYRWMIRLGTRLWHGDKSMLHLGATVVERYGVTAGDRVGYHATPCPVDGEVVVVAAGSAHGVAPHTDGASPLHFGRKRLLLVEPPHMHTTLALVAQGDPCPEVGERVDVQCPLTRVDVDEVIWSDEGA
jgi:alanine racemase